MTLAFYKGQGDLFDKMIRLWTRSPYSHTEIIIDGRWYSSSPRDGRVRGRVIVPTPGHWDFAEVTMTESDTQKVLSFLRSQIGKRYDWLGIFLSQIVPLGIQNPTRWFCSELCSAALKKGGMRLEKHPQWYSPGRLYERVRG